eukprot:GHVT01014334.1.p1 GENE.GHVT01014334.1~~GHVT01014334.1.p1  ORF type:complete len:278 (+),score=65.56 GHVT01014334.1:490-1323(+)
MAMDDEPAPAVPCGKSPRVRRASGLHVSVVSSADDSDEESQEETSHVVARNARESSEGYSVARRSGGLAALTNEPHVNLCSSPTGNDDGASAPSSPSSRPLSSSSLALPSLPAGSPTAPVESAGLSQRVRCYSREDAAELLATLPPARLLPPRTTQALSKIISPTSHGQMLAAKFWPLEAFRYGGRLQWGAGARSIVFFCCSSRSHGREDGRWGRRRAARRPATRGPSSLGAAERAVPSCVAKRQRRKTHRGNFNEKLDSRKRLEADDEAEHKQAEE